MNACMHTYIYVYKYALTHSCSILRYRVLYFLKMHGWSIICHPESEHWKYEKNVIK